MKFIPNRIRILFVLTVFLFISGCSGNNFDRSLILKNAADNLILPAYQDFVKQTDSLHHQASIFTQNPTKKTLDELKSTWQKAIKSWKRAEIYNFGPVESFLLVTSIDRWPTSENGIETIIGKYDDSDDFLVGVGSNRKGLPAIEYLLFHSEEDSVIREFSDPKRKAYLNLLATALAQNAKTIVREWENGYKNQFVSDAGNSATSGVTLLANELGYQLERIRKDKLGIPFGEQTMGAPRLQVLESIHAHISKELIRENLISAQNTFNGGTGNGFDDYLNELNIKTDNGELLSAAINNEFENSLNILDSIEGKLKNAMLNDKATVEKLITSIQNVYILTDVDMISQLGILIVFSDNDGD